MDSNWYALRKISRENAAQNDKIVNYSSMFVSCIIFI